MLERQGAAGRHSTTFSPMAQLLSHLETLTEPHLAALGSRYHAASVAPTWVDLKKSVFFSSSSTVLSYTAFIEIGIGSGLGTTPNCTTR